MEKFSFISLKDQVLQYIITRNEINYSDLALKILSEMDYDEVISLMESLSVINEKAYEKIQTAIKKMEVANEYNNKKYFEFETKVLKIYNSKIDNAKISLNEGDFIAFLIGLLKCIEKIKTHNFLNTIYNNIESIIVINLLQNIEILKTKINSQTYFPIENALYVFFIKDYEQALNIFKKIISKDIQERYNELNLIEYLTKGGLFFDRLSIDYIPKINVSSDSNITLSSSETSISKTELISVLDSKDQFNLDYPLKNTGKRLIIGKHIKVKDYQGIVKLFDILLNSEYEKKHLKRPSLSLGEIFFSNITQIFPPYSVQDLTLVRYIIRDLMNDNQNYFKNNFFSLMYQLNVAEYFTGITNLLPELLEIYFLKDDGFSKQTIKDFLISSKGRNRVVLDDYGMNFIKEHSIITGINILNIK